MIRVSQVVDTGNIHEHIELDAGFILEVLDGIMQIRSGNDSRPPPLVLHFALGTKHFFKGGEDFFNSHSSTPSRTGLSLQDSVLSLS